MRVSVLAAGQTSRTVSDREHRTHHTDAIESGNLDEVWKIFRIRSRSNLFNGQSIYLTDKVTNDIAAVAIIIITRLMRLMSRGIA